MKNIFEVSDCIHSFFFLTCLNNPHVNCTHSIKLPPPHYKQKFFEISHIKTTLQPDAGGIFLNLV